MTLDAPRLVHAGRSVAEIYDYGAHLWRWELDGEAVLWTIRQTSTEHGKPLRGGVPICWPWFGPGRSGDLTPAHGFARISDWTLTEMVESSNTTALTYTLRPVDAPQALPGCDWLVTYEVSVGDSLQLTLTVSNVGEVAFSYELALHTYLAVGDVRQVSVAGLDGAAYLDKVTGRRERQTGDVTITAETDRVYDRSGEVLVSDPERGRRTRISTQGAANTVVWNPWIAKSRAMPDFGDDEWTGMLCIEAGNVLENAVPLGPGDSRSLSYAVEVAVP